MFDLLHSRGPRRPARRVVALPPAGVRRGHEVRVGPDASPTAVLELLAAAEPSEASLSTLAALEPAALDDYDRVTALQLVDRHVGWLAALEQMFIVAVGGHAPSADDDLGRYEIAAALRLSDTTAGSRLLVARELTGRLAATGAALASGRLTYFHARALVDATMALDDDTTADVQELVLAGGTPDETLARFRRRVARAVIAAAPRTADEEHTAAVAERRVIVDPQPAGMAWLMAYLTAAEAAEVMGVVNADVDRRRAAGDTRPIDALRADALVAALTDPGDSEPGDSDATCGDVSDAESSDHRSVAVDPSCPEHRPVDGTGSTQAECAFPAAGVPAGAECTCRNRAQRRRSHRGGSRSTRPVIQVTIDLPTLLRLADHPAELAGYGPIPPELARQLAAGGDLVRFVTDPVTGHLLDYGRTRYRPPEALARFVAARDVTCRFPGCNQPARRCDLDHACAYSDDPDTPGGTTCAGNLGPLCRRHHRLKTSGRWRLESRPDGTVDWTSPAGHPYRRQPVDHHPEHTRRRASPTPPDDEPSG
jgi:hypothetical protein